MPNTLNTGACEVLESKKHEWIPATYEDVQGVLKTYNNIARSDLQINKDLFTYWEKHCVELRRIQYSSNDNDFDILFGPVKLLAIDGTYSEERFLSIFEIFSRAGGKSNIIIKNEDGSWRKPDASFRVELEIENNLFPKRPVTDLDDGIEEVKLSDLYQKLDWNDTQETSSSLALLGESEDPSNLKKNNTPSRSYVQLKDGRDFGKAGDDKKSV